MAEQEVISQAACCPASENNPAATISQRSRSSTSQTVHQRPSNLLVSKEGVSLPIEMCLKVVEEVLREDPKVGSMALMAVSKGFDSLLRKYQHSIVSIVSTREGTRGLYPTSLLSSWPRNARILAYSYPWLCEVRCRAHTVESLINHEVTNMVPDPRSRVAIDLLDSNVPKSELLLRVERFKRDALKILYGLADSTAALSDADIHAIRARQCSYLESLSTTQLAVLGVFTRALGLGYFQLTENDHPNKPSDMIRDRWIVFEDRVLRYGPFFAWATVVEKQGAIRTWSDEVMAQVLADMEAFETGRSQGYASLQSVLWKLFCVRRECDMIDSWWEAKGVVEKEMVGYDVLERGERKIRTG